MSCGKKGCGSKKAKAPAKAAKKSTPKAKKTTKKK